MTVLWWMLMAGCAEQPMEEHAPASLEARVGWEAAESVTRRPLATLPAVVEARPGAVHTLSPTGAGRLLTWAVAPGQVVAAGDVLAWWTRPDLSELEAEVRAARVEVERAQLQLDALRGAAAGGVRSQAEVQLAEADLRSAESRAAVAQRRLVARRDTTSRHGDRWAWESPVDGVVQQLLCEPGASADGACVELVDPQGGWLRVALPERYGAQIDGEPLSVDFSAVDGRQWSLSEAARAPALSPTTRSRNLWFSSSVPLELGASGRATVSLSAAADVVVVSERALTRLDGADAVFVRGGEAPEPLPVEVLGREGDRVFLRGPAAGDEVAVRGVFLLKSLALLDEEA